MSVIYSKFQHEVADLGKVKENTSCSAIYQFEPIVENNPVFKYAIPSCGCMISTWDNNTNRLTVKYSTGSISQFHRDLSMSELPQEKTITVFVDELGSLKEHLLTIKLTIIL